jgi:hypothetical protein
MDPVVEIDVPMVAGADGAAPPVPEEDPIHGVLRTCGVTLLGARMAFINVEGLDSLSAFTQLNGDVDVTEMAKRMSTRPANAGRVILGTIQIKRIQALVHWVKDHDKRGLIPQPELWDEDAMNEAMSNKEAELNYGKIDVGSIDPGKCRTDHGWDNWQIAFANKLNATLGAAKVPIDYIIRTEHDDLDHEMLFMEDDELRKYQMPLEGQNFKHDNRLVYKMLKAACVDTDAWAWIESNDPSADGRKAWLALINHYDGYGELNKRIQRSKMELMKLHYKDEKVFQFEKYVTKLKEQFRVLEKDKHERYSESRQVETLLRGMNTTDPGIVAAKTQIFHSMLHDFDKACGFMSAYISSKHADAQYSYANRHNLSGQRRNVSATGSDGDRGGRGRGGRSGQRGGRTAGRGRNGGRGRGSGRGMRSFINNVDVTDPHRNFTSAEWEKLGTMRGVVLRMRDDTTGRGGRGGTDSRSSANSTTNRTTSAVSASGNTEANANATTNDQSVVSDITERGSQNGRSFGRGAYNNN